MGCQGAHDGVRQAENVKAPGVLKAQRNTGGSEDA